MWLYSSIFSSTCLNISTPPDCGPVALYKQAGVGCLCWLPSISLLWPDSHLVWLLRWGPSTYKFESHFFRTGRRIAPKFCTHVRIDTLTFNFCFDPPHPRGVKRAYVWMMWRWCLCFCGFVRLWLCGWQPRFTYLFRDTTVRPRPNVARMCG